jgi:hypothetical protein
MITVQYKLREQAERFDMPALLAAIAGAALPAPTDVFCDPAALAVRLTFDPDPSGAQLTDIAALVEDQIIACFPLEEAKAKKFAEIDSRTRELVSEGFTHAGKVCSLSVQAQLAILGLYIVRASLTYPISWNTKDDFDAVSLADEAAVEAFFAEAIAAIRAPLDSGTAIKTNTRAAANRDAVKAISDNR